MSMNIIDMPEVPKEIINAVNDKKFAVFIGAGVSRLVGCYGWDELSNNLIDACFSEKLINFKERELLIHNENDQRKKITIAFNILRKDHENIFYDEMERALKYGKYYVKPELNIYKLIYQLRGLFLTTNADTFFDKYFFKSNIFSNFIASNLETRDYECLYHLHGSITDRPSLVFTLPQYIKRYTCSDFQAFINKIFDKYVVLFVGYGLNELELLEIILKNNAKPELKHFLLKGYFEGEKNLVDFDNEYYNEFGIKVIAYSKDKKGFDQLCEIISAWEKEINQSSSYLNTSMNEIDNALNSFDRSEAISVIRMIKCEASLFKYFFRKISEHSDPFPWISILKNQNLFNPKLNPKPIESANKGSFTVGFWVVMSFLENVSNLNKKRADKNISNTLVSIINKIIDYRDKDKRRIENYNTDISILKIISELPRESIEKKHIQFLKDSLVDPGGRLLISEAIMEKILPKLIEDKSKELLMILIEMVLEFKEIKIETHSDIFVSIMENYYLSKGLEKFKKDIVEICGMEAVELGLKKIQEIVNKDKLVFSKHLINTIEEYNQNISRMEYPFTLLSFVRDILVEMAPEKSRSIIVSLLYREHSIFKRLALYVIGKHYDFLKDEFWALTENPFSLWEQRHEVYELLKENCPKFEKAQMEKALDWIENADYYVAEEHKENRDLADRIVAYKKKEWLTALKGAGNQEVDFRYMRYDAMAPGEVEHPGHDFWIGTWSGPISPVSKEKILGMTPQEIVDLLNSFEKKPGAMAPDEYGLSTELRNALLDDTTKFTEAMEMFFNIKRNIYKCTIIRGFSEAWKAGKELDWDKVFSFIENITSNEHFWEENQTDSEIENRNAIIWGTTDLIEEGTKDDRHAYSPKFFPVTEKILLQLAQQTQSDYAEIGDLLHSVLNSLKARIFSAMVIYSLRYARLNEQKAQRWAISIKEDFSKRLEMESKDSPEFWTIIGQYLPNLHYLDPAWISTNFTMLFPIKDERRWEWAMTGYFFHANKIYPEIYNLIKDSGNFSKAILFSFKESIINDRVVQHVCVGYNMGWERLDDKDSLISMMIRTGRPDHVGEIVRFVARVRDEEKKKLIPKVRLLWKRLMPVLEKKKDKIEFQSIIAEIWEWATFFESIDDKVFEWLKLSVRFFNIFSHEMDFIEYLSDRVNHEFEKVAQLFLFLVKDANVISNFMQDEKEKLLQIFYDQKQNESADKICNLHAEKGLYFLRSVYERNQPKVKND